jgi:hypothetical protein
MKTHQDLIWECPIGFIHPQRAIYIAVFLDRILAVMIEYTRNRKAILTGEFLELIWADLAVSTKVQMMMFITVYPDRILAGKVEHTRRQRVTHIQEYQDQISEVKKEAT